MTNFEITKAYYVAKGCKPLFAANKALAALKYTNDELPDAVKKWAQDKDCLSNGFDA